MNSVLMQLVNRHLAFSATRVMRLLQQMAHACPDLVIVALPEIKREIQVVEQRRGVGYDSVLRSENLTPAGGFIPQYCMYWVGFWFVHFVSSAFMKIFKPHEKQEVGNVL